MKIWPHPVIMKLPSADRWIRFNSGVYRCRLTGPRCYAGKYGETMYRIEVVGHPVFTTLIVRQSRVSINHQKE